MGVLIEKQGKAVNAGVNGVINSNVSKGKTRYEQQKEYQEGQHQNYTNEEITASWLHGKAAGTKEIYTLDIKRFFEYFGGVHVGWVTAANLHTFADMLADTGQSKASQARIISAVKSLFSHAYKIGAIPFDVGGQLKTPKKEKNISGRILSHEEIIKMLTQAEKKPRDYAILRLFYVSGIRVSELCMVARQDIQEGKDGIYLNVLGKGNKPRTIFISDTRTIETIKQLQTKGNEPAVPVFRSQKGGRLDVSAVHRIVRKYAKKAGINRNVSPHWLRHAHASHRLDNGDAIHNVQNTLGHSDVSTTGLYLHARPNQSANQFLNL